MLSPGGTRSSHMPPDEPSSSKVTKKKYFSFLSLNLDKIGVMRQLFFSCFFFRTLAAMFRTGGKHIPQLRTVATMVHCSGKKRVMRSNCRDVGGDKKLKNFFCGLSHKHYLISSDTWPTYFSFYTHCTEGVRVMPGESDVLFYLLLFFLATHISRRLCSPLASPLYQLTIR